MPSTRTAQHLSFLIPEPGAQRIYGLSTLVNTAGLGLVFTTMTLYFTRVIHLSLAQVGVGLTISALVGMLTAVPAGDLADRHGPREMVLVTMALEAVAAACYLFIRGFASFVAVTALEMLIINAWAAADGALTRRVGGENGTKFRSVKQALANLGISVGALACGVAVQIGTPTAYRALIVGNALTFVAAAAIVSRLPRYAPLPRPARTAKEPTRWVALTDKPFVTFTALVGSLSVQDAVITLSLPLWVISDTHAPRWSVSLFLLLNTLIVATFQVRVGRNVASITDGGTALRQAGLIFLVSCSAIGLAAGMPYWVALLILTGAVAMHTLGEMRFAAAEFALDYGLAPAHAQGQYEGVLRLGTSAGQAAAPVLLVGLSLSWGRLGWIALGAYCAAFGYGGPLLARWGGRTRPAAPVPDSLESSMTSE